MYGVDTILLPWLWDYPPKKRLTVDPATHACATLKQPHNKFFPRLSKKCQLIFVFQMSHFCILIRRHIAVFAFEIGLGHSQAPK